jgi:uncharacterized membrane protein
MNAAYLHITLVHIPIVLMPTAAIFLALGLWRKNPSLTSSALWLSVVATLFTLPAFLLGEGAEEVVEHLPEISEHLIEAHEEVADTAFALCVAAGILSLVSIGLRLAGSRLYQTSSKVAFPLLVAASGALTYTAYEGGKIRHSEAHSSPTISSNTHRDHD